MTERLYYLDAYLRVFDGHVIESRHHADGSLVRLNRSAFYPSSGGQPHDTGTLMGGGKAAHVLNVEADGEGEVWHLIDRLLSAGTAVQGEIDWSRRFDHMQQHSGEHLLASALHELHSALTIGLHIGRELSTIDVEVPGGRLRLAREEVAKAEDLANDRVQADTAIRCWFPDAGELEQLPLRKKSAHKGRLRVVTMGGFERVACGGTHLASTGQCGLIKILGTEPVRGKMRVSFVCGARAIRYCRAVAEACEDSARLLSCRPQNLNQNVLKLLDENASLKHSASLLRREAVSLALASIVEKAPILPGGEALVRADLAEADPKSLREAASQLVGQLNAVALLSAPGEKGCHLVFARSQDLPYDMVELLRETGARGGGRSAFAEGFAATASPADLAVERLRTAGAQ